MIKIDMTEAASKLLQDLLALPERQRLEIASAVIASVDGPPDSDWEAAWESELLRRIEAARRRGKPAPSWDVVRDRVLARLSEL